jgi:hypothetical protein
MVRAVIEGDPELNRIKLALLSAACLALAALGSQAANAQDYGGSAYPGPYFIGSPEAPVVLEEYGDFQ